MKTHSVQQTKESVADIRQGRIFNADGHLFQLALEACRIRAAHLFDPYGALRTANIDPLPHQIAAVYDEMLSRRPLRFLLADDPGAGKTVMAGLLVKELKIRRELQRCLIVAPGNLTEQWQRELSNKFDLDFSVLAGTEAGVEFRNPFDRHDLLIARMDTLSRNDRHQAWLQRAREWDLIICDEAHRMAASFHGSKVRKTARYRLGELLSNLCFNFLLMTATPHNGKEEDFQLFMALLDPDRFAGRGRSGIRTANPQDLMRKLIKEDLIRFDGSPLFPERRAYTVQFLLSPQESSLYEAVTNYVREGMDRAERLDEGNRKQTVGFALQLLQRRLTSSPAAIHKSLYRRRQRLEQRCLEMTSIPARAFNASYRKQASRLLPFSDEWLEEATEEEAVDAELQVLNKASAASTAVELRAEIQTLMQLESKASALLESGEDTKWLQLASILDDPLVIGEGRRRKLVVFTEARDTLAYLADRIRTSMGRPETILEIHGGLGMRERQRAVERFTRDDGAQILVATDAAGEGINLQCAHLMVNYDLPWNPNRLEQRFGRIHRIGQTEVCHVWHLVAKGTREGTVYLRLLEKLEQARATLDGRVYDIMGAVFDSHSLRELMIASIRAGQNSAGGRRVLDKVEDLMAAERLQGCLEAQPLPHSPLDATAAVSKINSMQQTATGRLQPYSIQAFFLDAFPHLGGRIHPREKERWEITRVPSAILAGAAAKAGSTGIARRYPRVCFDRARSEDPSPAVPLGPGHALFDATVDSMTERYEHLLHRGTILVDPAADDPTDAIYRVYQLELALVNGNSKMVWHRIQFVKVDDSGHCTDTESSPFLDFRPPRQDELALVQVELENQRLDSDLDQAVMAHVRSWLHETGLPHFQASRRRTSDQAEQAIKIRLAHEINYWDRQAEEAKVRERSGRNHSIDSVQARKRAETLQERRQKRLHEFAMDRKIAAKEPCITGCALILPQGMLNRLQDSGVTQGMDSPSRLLVEQAAMHAVMEAERNLGYHPQDVGSQKLGYDVHSRCSETGTVRLIEVKGRFHEADDVTVTANEIRTALNEPERFILAIVKVGDKSVEQPRYVRMPFTHPPDPELRSSRYALKELLKRATVPC